jgi:hypothetical protein
MTVQHDPTGATPADSGADQPEAGRTTDTVKSEASNVAATAVGGAREVASEAGTQAKAVAGEAKQQLDRVIGHGRDELRQQAEARTAQAAGQLRTLSEQFGALLDGRREEAGPLAAYASELQGQLRRLASRAEQRGPQGIVDDVARFARQRPGPFLVGAAGLGFLVGRFVRAGVANQQENGPSSGDALPAPPNQPAYEEPSPLPPPVRSAGVAP